MVAPIIPAINDAEIEAILARAQAMARAMPIMSSCGCRLKSANSFPNGRARIIRESSSTCGIDALNPRGSFIVRGLARG
jgi:DNA repair photolyase